MHCSLWNSICVPNLTMNCLHLKWSKSAFFPHWLPKWTLWHPHLSSMFPSSPWAALRGTCNWLSHVSSSACLIFLHYLAIFKSIIKMIKFHEIKLWSVTPREHVYHIWCRLDLWFMRRKWWCFPKLLRERKIDPDGPYGSSRKECVTGSGEVWPFTVDRESEHLLRSKWDKTFWKPAYAQFYLYL